MADCKHENRKTLTLRFDKEKQTVTKDGIKTDPMLDTKHILLASICTDCGEVISQADNAEIQKLLDTACQEFFN